MVIALDVAGARKDRTVAGVSPLAELMACLHVLAEPDHHPEARTWVGALAGQIDDRLRSDLYRFAPLWARYRCRLFYPVGLGMDRSLSDELHTLTQVEDETFIRLAANAILGRAVSAGAEWAGVSDSWVRECEQRSFTRGDLAHSLVDDPGGFRDELVVTLDRCDTAFFAEEWKRSRPHMVRAAQAIRGRLRKDSVLSVLESLAPIASARGTTDRVYFDKLQSVHGSVGSEGLVLIPSVRAWPHVMVKMDARLPVVIHYPVQAVTRDGDVETQELLRRRLLALAEPNRWELCRHLIGEPITTTELAARTGSTKPAVSRNLSVLRGAGLITSQRSGRQVFHRMSSTVIVQLGPDILHGLIR